MEKMDQNPRITRGTTRDARPRKKVGMSEAGATGEQTSVVKQMAGRECEVSERDGVPEFLVDGEWRRVPNEHWAWTPSRITYRRCFNCSFRDDCRHPFWIDVRHFMCNV